MPPGQDSSHDPGWLRDLVDALPAVVYRSRPDAARSVLFVSGGCHALLGRRPDELAAADPQGGLNTVVCPDDAAGVSRSLGEAIAARGTFEILFRVRTPAGGVRWMLDRGRCVAEAGGGVTFLEGTMIDVTAVRVDPAQASGSERVASAVFEQSIHFVGLLDPDGRVRRANQAALRLIGLREEQVFGRFFWETPWWSHDAGQQARVQDAVRRCANGETVTMEAEHRRVDGVAITIDFAISPIRDVDGRVVALMPEGHDVTERRMAERALRESEEKLARAFAASPDAITITDLATGLIIDVNEGFEQLFEWARGDAVGRSSLELGLWANPHDRDRLREALGKQGRVRNFISVGRGRSGRLVRCLIAGELVEIAGETALILVIRDVTEQVRTEQALREGEERMRLLIENAPDAIVVIHGPDGGLVELNSEALRLFRGTRAQLTGMRVAELSPERQPDGQLSREAGRQHIMRAMAGGRPVFEWMHRALDGREIPCEVRLIRLPSPDAVLVRGSITDLSERKRAERAFRVLLEGTAGVSGQAFFESTVSRLARELNVRLAVVAEVEAGEDGPRLRCLARWMDGPGDPCDRDLTTTVFGGVLSGAVVQVESGLAALFPEAPEVGQLGLDSLLALPVLDRSGRVLGMVAIADGGPMLGSEAARLLLAVSASRAAVEIQHRRADEAIHRLNADLEQRVAERTAQLAAANAELESFSYSVSHDLRSPLRAIDGFSRALEEDCEAVLPEAGRDSLRRIRAASQRMGVLIDDLLRLSRAGRVDMKPEPVDLSALAESVVAELRMREPGRHVETGIEPGLWATGDRALLGILMQNLLDNAWKYTRRATAPRISFGRAGEPSAAGEPAGFAVRDNGAGLDMRYAGKLFTPFQRLHGPSEFEGTGIGLATVRRIVGRHGGRVWIEGSVGQGATVTFTLGLSRV